MYTLRNERGFTLIEILLVVAAIAVLAGVVIVAINPAKTLAEMRNADRVSHMNQIYKAITEADSTALFSHSHRIHHTTYAKVVEMKIALISNQSLFRDT